MISVQLLHTLTDTYQFDRATEYLRSSHVYIFKKSHDCKIKYNYNFSCTVVFISFILTYIIIGYANGNNRYIYRDFQAVVQLQDRTKRANYVKDQMASHAGSE